MNQNTKELLDSLRGKKIYLFLEVNKVVINAVGILIGGQLPGQPYGIHVELPDGSFNKPSADISFVPESVKTHTYTQQTHCFRIG